MLVADNAEFFFTLKLKPFLKVEEVRTTATKIKKEIACYNAEFDI